MVGIVRSVSGRAVDEDANSCNTELTLLAQADNLGGFNMETVMPAVTSFMVMLGNAQALSTEPARIAFAAETEALHTQAVCNALKQLNAAAASGGMRSVADTQTEAFDAITPLLTVFHYRINAQDFSAAAADRICSACADLPATLAATAQLLVVELQPRPASAPAAGADGAPPDNAPAPEAAKPDNSKLWTLADSIFALASGFVWPSAARGWSSAASAAAALQRDWLPWVSLAALLLAHASDEMGAAPAARSSGAANGTAAAGGDRETPAERRATVTRNVNTIVGFAHEASRSLDAGAAGSAAPPACLLESPDLQALMLALFALAVAHAHTRRPRGAGARARVPAAHVKLLDGLGLSHLATNLDASQLPVLALYQQPAELDALLALVGSTFLYSHHQALNAARQATRDGGAAAVPPILELPGEGKVAVPLLLTMVEAAQLLHKPRDSELLHHLLFVGASVLEAAAAAADGAGGNAAGGADDGTAVCKALLLQLAPVLTDVLQPAAKKKEDAHVEDDQALARQWGTMLGVVRSTEFKLHDKFTTMLLQQPADNALLMQAALRAQAQATAPGGPPPENLLWAVTVSTAAISAAASLRDSTALSKAAAADQGVARALFGALTTALKQAQAQVSAGSDAAQLPAVGIAGHAALTMLCLAAPGFDFRSATCSPADLTNPEWLLTAPGSKGATSSKDATARATSTRELPCSLLQLYAVLVGQALRCWSECVLRPLTPSSQLMYAVTPSSTFIATSLMAFASATHWLGKALPHLEFPGDAALAAATRQRLQEQQAALQAALDFGKMQQLARRLLALSPTDGAEVQKSVDEVVSREAAELGSQLATSLCAELPLPLFCNNPGCTNMGCLSEEVLVRGRLCASCKKAAYCSPECLSAHWKAGHRPACKRLKSAGAGASTSASAATAAQA